MGYIFQVTDLESAATRLANGPRDRVRRHSRRRRLVHRPTHALSSAFRLACCYRSTRVLDDDICGYRRLARLELEASRHLTPQQERGLRRGKYSDSDWVIPYDEHEELNRQLFDSHSIARDGFRRTPGSPPER